MVRDEVEQDFPEPAGKCGCEKKQCVVVKWVYVHVLFHNVIVSVKFVMLFKFSFLDGSFIIEQIFVFFQKHPQKTL